MVFESALFAYLDHLRIERGLSNNSIAAYRRDLLKFGDFLSDDTHLFGELRDDLLHPRICVFCVYSLVFGLVVVLVLL